jgi:hypothetical protein
VAYSLVLGVDYDDGGSLLGGSAGIGRICSALRGSARAILFWVCCWKLEDLGA